MPRKYNTWVLVRGADVDPHEPRPHGICTRCGERLVTLLPMRSSVYIAMCRAFVKAHDHCREPAPKTVRLVAGVSR